MASGTLNFGVPDGVATCEGDVLGPDLYFGWEATEAGLATFDTVGSAADTVLELYPAGDSCNQGGAMLEYNDDLDDITFDSAIQLAVSPGDRFFITVPGFEANEVEGYGLRVNGESAVDGGAVDGGAVDGG